MTLDLLELVAADLPSHQLVRLQDGTIDLIPKGGGPSLHVTRSVQRRFLGRTEVALFQMNTGAPGGEKARLQVHHTGRLRRQGIDVRLVGGQAVAARVARELAADNGFTTAAGSLDFTRFDLELDGTRCMASVEMMGASLVLIAFPPIRSYVRLHPEQREALLDSLSSVQRLLDRLFPQDTGRTTG